MSILGCIASHFKGTGLDELLNSALNVDNNTSNNGDGGTIKDNEEVEDCVIVLLVDFILAGMTIVEHV